MCTTSFRGQVSKMLGPPMCTTSSRGQVSRMLGQQFCTWMPGPGASQNISYGPIRMFHRGWGALQRCRWSGDGLTLRAPCLPGDSLNMCSPCLPGKGLNKRAPCLPGSGLNKRAPCLPGSGLNKRAPCLLERASRHAWTTHAATGVLGHACP